MRKALILTLTMLCFTCMAGTARAEIIPLVIESSFTNDSWFPLPVAQMKSAAVDTALTKISATNKFAFLYSSSDKHINPGLLSLAVTLVEPAESAQLTIKLNLPDNNGSYVSSSSVSLSDKNHKQIYRALQALGNAAAEQLNLSASEIGKNTSTDDQSRKIYQEIMTLNINVIKLHKEINTNAMVSHNSAIYSRLGKLDTIIGKLDKHHQYVKNSNTIQNKKLDAIYSELQKLNIGANTGNSLPDARELTPVDVKLLPIVDTAIKLKYKKDFSGAASALSKVTNTRNISSLFKNAVQEELFINLPLYEADTRKTELSYGFMDQVKGDRYQQTVSRIRSLYESVLKRPDVRFEKRAEIKQKMDSLMISADSMDAVVKMMRRNELANFRTMLRVDMQRMMISGYASKDGLCPDNNRINNIIRKANMKIFRLGSLKQTGEWCNLYLTDELDNSEHIKFNYEEVIIIEQGTAALTSTIPEENAYRGPGNLMLQQTLRNKVILLSNAISSYYKKHKVLPKSISDIKCRDPFNRMAEVACASAQKDGVFYINHVNNWVAIESYLTNGKIFKKCRATIPLDMLDHKYGECTALDVNSIPAGSISASS